MHARIRKMLDFCCSGSLGAGVKKTSPGSFWAFLELVNVSARGGEVK
jgi:hypothetical protein